MSVTMRSGPAAEEELEHVLQGHRQTDRHDHLLGHPDAAPCAAGCQRPASCSQPVAAPSDDRDASPTATSGSPTSCVPTYARIAAERDLLAVREVAQPGRAVDQREPDATPARAAVPKTRPLTVCWATRAAVTPDPVDAGASGRRRRPRRPWSASRSASPVPASSAAGGRRRRPSGKSAAAEAPRLTVTVRGLLPGSRSVSPAGSVATSRVTVVVARLGHGHRPAAGRRRSCRSRSPSGPTTVERDARRRARPPRCAGCRRCSRSPRRRRTGRPPRLRRGPARGRGRRRGAA